MQHTEDHGGLAPDGELARAPRRRRLEEPASDPPPTKLLKTAEVLLWLKGRSYFQETLDIEVTKCGTPGTPGTTKLTAAEAKWGKKTLQSAFPGEVQAEKMWTGKIGETIVQEHFPEGWKPEKKGGMQPDWETREYVYEVKTQSYFTSGTAGEKILGVPLKYRNIPDLYGKPLRILCLAGAEEIAVKFELNSANPMCPKIKALVNLWKEWGITYAIGSELFEAYSVSN